MSHGSLWATGTFWLFRCKTEAHSTLAQPALLRPCPSTPPPPPPPPHTHTYTHVCTHIHACTYIPTTHPQVPSSSSLQFSVRRIPASQDFRGGFEETISDSSFSTKNLLPRCQEGEAALSSHRGLGAARVLGGCRGPDMSTAVQAVREGCLRRPLPDRGAAGGHLRVNHSPPPAWKFGFRGS